MSPNPDDPIQRRRERGRRSQAAFRKRQAQAVKDLEDDNRRLKESIHKLVSTAGGSAPHSELLASVNHLAEAAGIDNSRSLITSNARPQQGGYEGPGIGLTARDFSQGPAQFSTPPATTALDHAATPQRLTFDIWLDPLHYARISLPPGDIVPYLWHGADTFAGRLFWSVLDHVQRGCHRGQHDKPAVLIQRSLTHSKAVKQVKPSFIEAMIEARLEYRNTGSISPRHMAVAEQDLSSVVSKRVTEDYRETGRDLSRWLTCLDIENHARRMLGVEVFGLLDRAIRGEGDIFLRNSMDDIKCRLYDSSVCFGDGPRWHVNVVDALFLGVDGNWLAVRECLA